MEKKILTSNTIGAVGPYSLAVEAGGLIFISGQLPVLPETGEIITEVKAASFQALTNLRTILQDNGLTLDHIIKTTIYLTNMADFADVNEIYASFFADTPPARSTVEVSALPKGSPLEIEAIAVRK
jgi:2-iminobutanoate/2-iminopropanoate deaminase